MLNQQVLKREWFQMGLNQRWFNPRSRYFDSLSSCFNRRTLLRHPFPYQNGSSATRIGDQKTPSRKSADTSIPKRASLSYYGVTNKFPPEKEFEKLVMHSIALSVKKIEQKLILYIVTKCLPSSLEHMENGRLQPRGFLLFDQYMKSLKLQQCGSFGARRFYHVAWLHAVMSMASSCIQLDIRLLRALLQTKAVLI